MEHIRMSGLDWSSAGLSAREALSFTAQQVKALDQALCALDGVEGAVLLSTCNRTEIYLSVSDDALPAPAELLCRTLGTELGPYWTHRTGRDAARHLMEVAGGLQSHIWGEDQIISQVKAAIAQAREAESADALLETLFRHAATAGKELKSKLRLSGASASAAQAAVAWLNGQTGQREDRHALVIGNGEMGRLCARLLSQQGWRVTVTLRTYRHGETVVPYGCSTVPYDGRYEVMDGLDALISATTSPHFTITEQDFSLSSDPPRFLVDLAVPRDIEPAVGQLPGVRLVNIDDLGETVERRLPPQAEEIIEKYLRQLAQWVQYRKAMPALEHLKDAVQRRVLATAGAEAEDEALVALAVGKAVDLLSGALKEHLDPQTLEAYTRKIELHTRERGKNAGASAPFRFPLFVDLSGQRCVVVGGGGVACRRAGVLRQFGAQVTLIAPACKNLPEGVEWLERGYHTDDLEGCALAVAATDDRAVNRQVGTDARALGIPVSVADAPEECTFFFPAVCTGERLVAGVVSDGTDHHRTARAAKAIRKTLEEL